MKSILHILIEHSQPLALCQYGYISLVMLSTHSFASLLRCKRNNNGTLSISLNLKIELKYFLLVLANGKVHQDIIFEKNEQQWYNTVVQKNQEKVGHAKG